MNEKLICFFCLGISTFSICFFIKIIIKILKAINIKHIKIGKEPLLPKTATINGPTPKPIEIAELYKPIDFPLLLLLETIFTQVSIVIQFMPPVSPMIK